MRIAIVGAGAIGGWLGAQLINSGQEVSVLARGATLAAIRRNGLQLTSGGKTTRAPVKASDNASDLGEQNFIIVAVKGHALGAAAPAIAAMMSPATTILPAMNGVPWWLSSGLRGPAANMPLPSVDPDGTIGAAIPVSRVIGCVVHVSASVLEPGHIVHAQGKRLILGEPSGEMTDRLTLIASALGDAGLDIVQSPHIRRDIWYKLWGNMTFNPISALTGATVDRIIGDPLTARFTLAVMAEAKEIGQRIGCPIPESGEDRMKVTSKLGAIKTSMLQDAEAGRPLEIDALLAAPREIAAKLGIATPYMDALHGLTRLKAQTQSHG